MYYYYKFKILEEDKFINIEKLFYFVCVLFEFVLR